MIIGIVSALVSIVPFCANKNIAELLCLLVKNFRQQANFFAEGIYTKYD